MFRTSRIRAAAGSTRHLGGCMKYMPPHPMKQKVKNEANEKEKLKSKACFEPGAVFQNSSFCRIPAFRRAPKGNLFFFLVTPRVSVRAIFGGKKTKTLRATRGRTCRGVRMMSYGHPRRAPQHCGVAVSQILTIFMNPCSIHGQPLGMP